MFCGERSDLTTSQRVKLHEIIDALHDLADSIGEMNRPRHQGAIYGITGILIDMEMRAKDS